MRFRHCAALAATVAAICLLPLFTSTGEAAQQETPTMTLRCDDVMARHAAGTPSTMTGDMAGMAMGTPPAMEMAFDQIYIDMMIPHHASIIALAQAALPRLSEARLQQIAQNVIDTQSAEIAELRGYREQWYGSPDPMPMDASRMRSMMQQMPSMTGSMEEMAMQMDAQAQVAAFCAEADPDLAFIDLTIPHHLMAIEASETAVTQATHPEIQAFAQRVTDDQQREIAELQAIRVGLAGQATPTDA